MSFPIILSIAIVLIAIIMCLVSVFGKSAAFASLNEFKPFNCLRLKNGDVEHEAAMEHIKLVNTVTVFDEAK